MVYSCVRRQCSLLCFKQQELVQERFREMPVRVATFLLAGARQVGAVDLDSRTVAPFALPAGQAAEGVLSLIEAVETWPIMPRTLSSIPLSEVELEAPIPLPRRNIFCVGKNYH